MKKKKRVNYAKTNLNSIYFYSNRHKGYAAKAMIDKYGEIKTSFEKMEENNDTKANIIFGIVVILLTLSTYTVWITRVILILEAILSLSGFIGIILIGKRNRHGENFRRLHGAEHTVVNAYEKLGRIPTVEEASKFSRFNNNCGTNYYSSHFITVIVLVIMSFNLTSWYRVIAFFTIIFISNALVKLGVFNFTQFITTQNPKKEELEVAIEGIKLWEKKEEQEAPYDYDDHSNAIKETHMRYRESVIK